MAPFVYLIAFMGVVFFMIANSISHPGTQTAAPTQFTNAFFGLMIVHGSMAFFMMGLTGFYIYLAVINRRYSDQMRLMWTLLILFGSLIVMPIYWYLNIWKDPIEVTETVG